MFAITDVMGSKEPSSVSGGRFTDVEAVRVRGVEVYILNSIQSLTQLRLAMLFKKVAE